MTKTAPENVSLSGAFKKVTCGTLAFKTRRMLILWDVGYFITTFKLQNKRFKEQKAMCRGGSESMLGCQTPQAARR